MTSTVQSHTFPRLLFPVSLACLFWSGVWVPILILAVVAVVILGVVFILFIQFARFVGGTIEKEKYPSKQLQEAEQELKFEEHVRAWVSGSISDEQFKSLASGLEISGARLTEMIRQGETDVTEEEIQKLRNAGMVSKHDTA